MRVRVRFSIGVRVRVIYKEGEVTIAKALSIVSAGPLQVGVEIQVAVVCVVGYEPITADGSTCFAATSRGVRGGIGRVKVSC